MAQQTISIGSTANDGTGDTLRDGGDKINDNFDELYAAVLALPLTFNFTAAGDAYFYADAAMTLTEQATTGAGSISYEKGTTASPDTFSSTTSPITLQAGAWLKVTADDAVAVHLKRTA